MKLAAPIPARFLRAAAVLASLANIALAGDFLGRQDPARVTTGEVEASLTSTLAGNASRDRLASLEDALRTTYASLPRGEQGLLGHQAVRYALHRLLLQRHGWFVVGLEPNDEAPPPYLQGEWVPSYLQGLLETRLGGRGIDLHELAALAAAIEDLVKQEVARRVQGVYELLQVPLHERLGPGKASAVLTTYLMSYLGANFSGLAPSALPLARESFAIEYSDWKAAEAWLQEVEGPYLADAVSGGLDVAAVSRAAGELGERFGAFNDGECRDLKRTLLEIEDDRRPGRVRLSDFYRKGLHSHWEFNEKVEYLRQLGALDESLPSLPRVIVPNYLGSRSNCLEASSLYAVCCRNECEDLMGRLEHQIQAPSATVERITGLVAAMPSESVAAPRNLSASLLGRLREIEREHGGLVPLHGRLFAQWMHHAYPRECPYPHEAGTLSPQTPDEWMRETGEESTRADVEERMKHVEAGTCSGDGPCRAAPASVLRGTELHQEGPELPWTTSEALLVGGDRARGTQFRFTELMPSCVILCLLIVLKLTLTVKQCAAEVKVAPAKRQEHETPWHAILALVGLMGIAVMGGFLDKGAFFLALSAGLVAVVGPRFMAKSKPSLKSKLADDFA